MLSCFAHAVNLGVKAFLKGIGSSLTTETKDVEDVDGEEMEEDVISLAQNLPSKEVNTMLPTLLFKI
jgi:hypothetical protein